MDKDENTPPAQGKPAGAPPKGGEGFNVMLQQLWQGEIPLIKTFWLYYLAALFVLRLLGNLVPGMGNLFFLLQLVWAGFMVKPIMVAADKYKGPSHWGMAAKIVAVVIAAAIALDIVAGR